MMSQKVIHRYLVHARTHINQTLEAIMAGDAPAARSHLKKARYEIRSANSFLLRKHASECIPGMIRENTESAIKELIKTFKYSSV